MTVAEGAGKGIEAAARCGRYRALAGLAREHGAPLVLLAHHRGDQAETVLLRLLRGTGLAGMAAMAPLSRRDEVDYLRPWLTRTAMTSCEPAAFEAATGWRAVQDPTNSDPHYTRAALRELLAPALDALARLARHRGAACAPYAEAASILDEVAREDFAALERAGRRQLLRARGAICRRRGRRRCCAGGWTPMARACLRKRACATCCASCAACTAWVMTASCASSRPAMRSAATVAGSGWSVAESRSGLAGTPLSPGQGGVAGKPEESPRLRKFSPWRLEYEVLPVNILGAGSQPEYEMSLIVHKYGGTSMGSVERIRNVARRVAKWHAAGHQVVVVPSAMAGETNRLLGLAREISPVPDGRELDMIAATGEQASSGLLAIALQAEGVAARSYAGWQVPVRTDSSYTKARITSIDDARIRADLDAGRVVIVTGFQGVDADGHITTLGRGGSDTSAVAVAAAIKADECLIYTDVDGVYDRPARRARSAPHGGRRSRKCSRWPRWAPRSCRSARSNSPANTVCRRGCCPR